MPIKIVELQTRFILSKTDELVLKHIKEGLAYTIEELDTDIPRHRSSIYRSLEKLSEKGIMSKEWSGGKVFYYKGKKPKIQTT